MLIVLLDTNVRSSAPGFHRNYCVATSQSSVSPYWLLPMAIDSEDVLRWRRMRSSVTSHSSVERLDC